jgi:hypothetical protein
VVGEDGKLRWQYIDPAEKVVPLEAWQSADPAENTWYTKLGTEVGTDEIPH